MITPNESPVLPTFHWTTFDLNNWLPSSWQQDVAAAAKDAEVRAFPRTPVISRESQDVQQVARGRVHADKVRHHLPWLFKAYKHELLDLAKKVGGEHVRAAEDDRYGVVLNVQRGSSMRFECHVDSNPLTGLLFCTDHRDGGELVIANDPEAEGISEVERDCSVIRPHAGHLIFFGAQQYPHYARVLTADSETRVVAVMNFYTDSSPESTRPRELNRHLYGDKWNVSN
jgi:hypothetical protein